MTLRILKEIWEFLCIIVLGAPFMVVGYFGTFIVFGVVTGHRLYLQWHRPDVKPDSNKTSP